MTLSLHLNMDGEHAIHSSNGHTVYFMYEVLHPSIDLQKNGMHDLSCTLDTTYECLLVSFQHSTHDIQWSVYPGSSEIPKSS